MGDVAGAEREAVPPLPVWLMGFAYAPVGIGCATTFVAIPQLLAAQAIPAPLVASLTAAAVLPGFAAFLFGPLLDWRFPRKNYAILFYLLGGLGLMACLIVAAKAREADIALIAGLEFSAQLLLSIGASAVGGWFSGLVPKRRAGALGAWFTAWNIGAGGVTALIAVPLLRLLPLTLGAAAIGFLAFTSLVLLLALPCKPADGRLAKESLQAFAGDVAKILNAPIVWWTLLIFLSPAASFALTNVVGGLGAAFSTSEAQVSMIFGFGAVVAGVAGSLLMPVLEKRIAPRFLYLGIGLAGAVGTAAIAFLPREAPVFALAVLQANFFQAAAFSVCYAIILRTIGPDDPLAATQYGLLQSAFCLPLTYMQVLDAKGLEIGGVTGAFLMDAGVSAAACLILLAVFTGLRRRIPPG